LKNSPAVQILLAVLPWALIIGAWFVSRNAQKMPRKADR
jgi:hypothetical protein